MANNLQKVLLRSNAGYSGVKQSNINSFKRGQADDNSTSIASKFASTVSKSEQSKQQEQDAQEQATSISKLKFGKVKNQIEELIKKFTTSERKTASLTLSKLANKDPEAKPLVVDTLIVRIVGDKEENAYLKNLYIALTHLFKKCE